MVPQGCHLWIVLHYLFNNRQAFFRDALTLLNFISWIFSVHHNLLEIDAKSRNLSPLILWTCIGYKTNTGAGHIDQQFVLIMLVTVRARNKRLYKRWIDSPAGNTIKHRSALGKQIPPNFGRNNLVPAAVLSRRALRPNISNTVQHTSSMGELTTQPYLMPVMANGEAALALTLPHMTFGEGDSNVVYQRNRTPI